MCSCCVSADETEGHIDYEDKFTDSYGEAERHGERPEEAHGEVYEEVHGAVYPMGKTNQEQQEMSFSVKVEEEHQDQHGEPDVRGEVIGRTFEGAVEEEREDEERAVEDFTGHPRLEEERKVDAAAATEATVSLLSQKHLFWFPSEAFQDEAHPVSTNPTTQRASGAQSEESKEHESQERHYHQLPVDIDDHDHSPDTDDQGDHDDSNHDDLDAHNDSHYDDPNDRDSHQDERDPDDSVKLYFPRQHDDLDRRDRHKNYDNHDDHYDMGEHEEDRERVRYGSQEYDDREDTYDENESIEDVTEDHGDVDGEHSHGSKEHPDHDDHDDGEKHYDLEEDDHDRYTDHDDHDDHEHDDHDSYDDHESHEDVDDGHQHVIFSIARDDHQNVTQKGKGEEVTTDETWLDGYPVVPAETENEDSTTDRVGRPKDVEIRRPDPYTNSPELSESPTMEPAVEQGGEEESWLGFGPTAAPSPDRSQPSDSPSYSDTLDYDTQQAAPTHSWLDDLTEHPFLNHDPAAPEHGGDILMEEHTVHNLPGESGERGEMEGDMGEAICTGENCPPPSSSNRAPTVAAIIVLVCAVAVAVIVGVWCYRRQQQKSSMYEMNGKGQSPNRQGQQIEMQQKV